MARHYHELPKKYTQQNKKVLPTFASAWTWDEYDEDYVYLIYLTRVHGDCDKVYRYTTEEYIKLIRRYNAGDHQATLYAITQCSEPYIITDPVF